MAKIIRFCLKNEDKYGDNVFTVCRPSIFGNPYTHIKNKETKALYKVKSRDMAIDLYEEYFDQMLKEDQEFRDAWDKLYEAYKNYDEIYLGCFCDLSERCHSDIIAKKLKKRSVLEMLGNAARQYEKDHPKV